MTESSLVILGAGYTARFLFPLASRRYNRVFATSRQPEKNLSHLPTNQHILFNLEEPDTWKHVPTETDLLWCFPAMPVDLVRSFAGALRTTSRRIVVLGSTSAYKVDVGSQYPPPWTDEHALIDLSKPRVQGEEFLRTSCGAIVLRVAGIYGPGRNPIDWIRTGRVSPSHKYVNLIHVEDLARICIETLKRGKPGEIYNVSDGTPRTWKEICLAAQQRWAVQSVPETNDGATGKRISNEKLLSMLGTTQDVLHHTDFFRSLE